MVRGVALALVSACSFTPGAIPARGDANTTDADAMVDMMSDAPSCRAVAIAASGAHTCAVRNDGSVMCWGKNGQGEIAKPAASSDTCNGSFACVKSPFQANIADTIVGVGLGDQHSCALSATKAYCWGANDSGQFGNGMLGDSSTPVEIAARAGATQIGGGNVHTCSLASGMVSCSGTNADGALGDSTTTQRFTPVTALSGATYLGVGFQNTCAIVAGDVKCWGDNTTRQVDNSAMTPRTSPLSVGVGTAIAVAPGFGHVCAVLANKTASCWGENDQGQLGRNNTSSPQGPAAVTVATNIEELVAGVNHVCVRLATNAVACWGEGYGTSPVTIALARPAHHLAAGSYHSCAILDDGTVWCWGWNAYAQYGNGTDSSAVDNTPLEADVCP